MPALTRVVGLYCGQGMAHLIEIYSAGVEKPAPDYLVLADFGGDAAFSADAVDYVYAKLKAQSDAGRNAKFDLTVVSHQDKDHLILLGPLKDKIEAEGLTIQFGKVFLGGLDWDAKNKKVVNDFFGISMTRPAYDWSEDERSDYAGKTTRAKLGKLVEFAGVAIRVLISQLAVAKGGRDVKRNASSTVLVVENGTQSVVLPGDATYHTMEYVNELYAAWGKKPLLPAVRAVEVPHHGAIRTAVENYVASKQSVDLDMGIITLFAKNLYADVVFASAGYLNNHGHPVQEVFEVFIPHTVMVKEHVYVAFVFNDKTGRKKERYEEFTTDDAVVTTLIEISDGPVWKNITIRLASVAAATTVSNRHSLRELLVMDGIEPPASMGSRAFSPRDPRPVARAAAPAAAHAPAPTDVERAAPTPPVRA